MEHNQNYEPMKTLLKIAFLAFVISLTSCRNTKKENAKKVETAVDSIQIIEQDAEQMIDQIDEEAKKIEEELLELENIDQ